MTDRRQTEEITAPNFTKNLRVQNRRKVEHPSVVAADPTVLRPIRYSANCARWIRSLPMSRGTLIRQWSYSCAMCRLYVKTYPTKTISATTSTGPRLQPIITIMKNAWATMIATTTADTKIASVQLFVKSRIATNP